MIITNSVLSAMMSKVNLAVGVRSIQEITSYVKIILKKGVLTIEGTDANIHVTAKSNDIKGDDINMFLKADILLSWLKLGSPSEEVTFTPAAKYCTLSAGSRSFKMHYHKTGKGFPRRKAGEEVSRFKVTIEPMGHCLTAIKKDTQMAMAGVRFNPKEMVSTDGHRLCMYRIEGGGPFTLPADTAQLLTRIGEKEFEVILYKEAVTFESESLSINSSLINDAYPDWESVIPKDVETYFSVNREEFMHALENIRLATAGSPTQKVSITITDKELKMKGKGEGIEGNSVIPCSAVLPENMKTLQIDFNVNYLLPTTKISTDEEIRYYFTTPEKPVITKGWYDDKNMPRPEDFLYLVMPIRKT